MQSVDVVVIGAGPAGCACAMSFAQRGARVVVLESQPGIPRRLSGEWIQPAGVNALHRMGVDLLAEATGSVGRGFMVHPADGSPAIALPHPTGTSVSLPHARLTAILRDRITDLPGVELITSARVRTIEPLGIVHTSATSIRAPLVVGADGRSSVVRAFLTRGAREAQPRTTLSHLAGLTLEDAPLPAEAYGHIMLGGLGPALIYRLDEHTVRVCLDVPPGRPHGRELNAYLGAGFTETLPPALRRPVAAQLRHGRVQWAANHFRRRTCYGSDGYALVGDAVGQAHPLVASGLTNAFLDAETLARSANVAAYAHERSGPSWTSDRLGAGIHRLFTDNTPATQALRRAVFGMWRVDSRRRDRSLMLLGMTEQRRSALVAAFSAVVRTALVSRTRHAVVNRRLPDLPQEIGGLISWLGWLAGPNVGIPQQVTTIAARPFSVGPRGRAGNVGPEAVTPTPDVDT